LAVTTSNDDGFREIQLNGKQLVFLFMAVTVVLVVTFLTGVLVGRGVRAERVAEQQTEALSEAPAEPPRGEVAPTAEGGDPTKAATPPTERSEEPQVQPATPPLDEQPPVAVNREAKAEAPSASKSKPAETAKANAPVAPAPAKTPEPAAAAPSKPPAPGAPATSAPAPAAATSAAARTGYAVQVAAVNAKGEADSIAKRLAGKGYSAYVEDPKGSQKMYRVRVGTFKTRREAQTTADRLKKEENFKPWVTR
jgi:cell division protein FtsN